MNKFPTLPPYIFLETLPNWIVIYDFGPIIKSKVLEGWTKYGAVFKIRIMGGTYLSLH